MDAPLLTQYITDRIRLTDDELALALSRLRPRQVAKNEVLVGKGEVCRQLFFVEKGCIRTYYLQQNGSEATRYIAFEGIFGTALASFISEQPTLEYVQALEPSELLVISRTDFYALLDEIPAWERLYRISLEYAQVLNTWRLESLISMDAKARHDHLMATDPQIIRRCSNRIVASYLGITQESLSRLKAQR
jgi:CRP-like cAMP-binding protein